MAEVADRWHRTDRATGARVRTDRYGVGKRWLARWRDDTGAQRKRAFERKADAERFLVEVAADLARGAYVDPRAGRVTVREYAERWPEAQVHRATTAAQVETHLRRHLYPTFGNRPLISVRPSEVQAWIRGLEQHLAPSTIGVVYSFLAGIFRAAVRDRATPGRGVRPRAGGGRLPARTLEVRQQLVTMPGQAPYLAPPKTPASYRTIPLPQVVVDALAAHLVAFPAVEVELLDTTVKPEPRRRPAALIFTRPAGGPLRRTKFSTIWRPAAASAELGEGVTYHDLRHYYASLLIGHGESVKVVQKRLGHKSAVETLDTYSHLWPDSEDRTREAVDQVLGRAAAERGRAWRPGWCRSMA